jgi:hypothetical protein
MQLTRLIASAAVAAATVAVVTGFKPIKPRELVDVAPGSAEAAEVRRIKIHFDSVLADLSARDASPLTDGQRARRSAVISTLRAYRDRGVFPHNYDFPGQAVPYFVDRKTGTLCAVAHLLASTGRRDIVDRVSRADNNVWVPELSADSAFSAWLTDNGLTLAEAAHIQVPYAQPVSNAEIARDVAFIVAAPFALTGSAITSGWNLAGNADGHRGWVNGVGIASGLTTILVGARLALSDVSHNPGRLGAATAAIGTMSLGLSVRGIRRHRDIVEAEREAQRKTVAQATVAPIVTTGSHPTAGVGVSLRF